MKSRKSICCHRQRRLVERCPNIRLQAAHLKLHLLNALLAADPMECWHDKVLDFERFKKHFDVRWLEKSMQMTENFEMCPFWLLAGQRVCIDGARIVAGRKTMSISLIGGRQAKSGPTAAPSSGKDDRMAPLCSLNAGRIRRIKVGR
jgi:hypothetical protein